MDRLVPIDRLPIWQELGLFFETLEERERWQRVYFLNTVPAYFLHWLEDKFYGDRARHRPVASVGRGEIFLDDLQVHFETVIRCWITFRYEERIAQSRGPAKVESTPLGTLIFFKALPLSMDRIKVEASCLSPCIIEYYRHLLREIGLAWPEAVAGEPSPIRVRRSQRTSANANRDAEIYRRFNEGQSRQQLADEYNLTPDRIKQIVREQRDREAS